jgi:hypothetical protein
MAENNAWGRGSQRGSSQPHAVRAREATPVEPTRPAGRGGSAPPRETRELYHSQSPWGLEANEEAGRRPELRAEEKALIEEQLKSPELRPLVCLVEARGLGLMRSAREGDELRTGTNMRALLSAIASGREEIERIGRRHGWSVGVREEILDRLQAMVREPIQRGGDIIMSSIPHTWREQAMRRVSKAEGVIEQMTSAITTQDWSLQHCHDYLVELEMVTSGALMALRLTANDISSEQVSPQAECLGSKARKARNMVLELRQKHLDAKLQVKDRPVRTFQEAMGGTSGPGPGSWRGYSGPQFSGRLEDLREFKRSWDEYERQYFPKESEEVLMEIMHTQALGPKARKAVEQAHSLGTTWTYLEDHLREQRERIDNLLSDTLRAGEPVGPEELYLYYKKVCQFLDTEEGESNVNDLITMDQLDMLLCTLPSEETFRWGRWKTYPSCSMTFAGSVQPT